MKKLTALVLALSMILSMGIATFAAEQTGTITVNNVTADTVLELYQILAYTLNDDGSYRSVEFVEPVSAYQEAFVDAINASYGTIADDASVSAIMLYITNEKLSKNADFAAELAKNLNKVVETKTAYKTALKDSAVSNSITFDNVAAGYYLILDATDYSGYDTFGAVVMLQPTNPNVVVSLKSSYQKEDTEKIIPSGYTDGSANVGDVIPYAITAYVPKNESDGSEYSYTYVLTDTMGEGLALVADSVKITINDEAVTAIAEYVTINGQVMEFTFTDLNSHNGDKIEITYRAAVTNTANYSNIVNTVGESINGEEFQDIKVEIKAYGIVVNKVDEYGNKLEGVKFYLKNAAGEYLIITNGVYVGTTSDVSESLLLTTNQDGMITVNGLAIGTYYLEEFSTLPGYNLLVDDETVSIIADNNDDDLENSNDAYVAIKVTNFSGVELPSTGGTGTGAFAVVGACAMLSACAFLFLNRKRRFN